MLPLDPSLPLTTLLERARANQLEWATEYGAAHAAWLLTQPTPLQAAAAARPPDNVYTLRTSTPPAPCYVVGYTRDGQVVVALLGTTLQATCPPDALATLRP